MGREELGPILQLVCLSSHCGAAVPPWGHLLPVSLHSPPQSLLWEPLLIHTKGQDGCSREFKMTPFPRGRRAVSLEGLSLPPLCSSQSRRPQHEPAHRGESGGLGTAGLPRADKSFSACTTGDQRRRLVLLADSPWIWLRLAQPQALCFAGGARTPLLSGSSAAHLPTSLCKDLSGPCACGFQGKGCKDKSISAGLQRQAGLRRKLQGQGGAEWGGVEEGEQGLGQRWEELLDSWRTGTGPESSGKKKQHAEKKLERQGFTNPV